MSEKTSEEQVRVHLIIQGRVQGVFFRNSTQEEATRLKLKGWVRNCPDGSVEALAEGKKRDIEEWIHWCRNGPPRARVLNVNIRWNPYEGGFLDFQIRR
ncbi:MAG: acylphosphatase [Candidatus Binatia bacterium]|jgi:acylphosphatase|nr:acylphosphatase [Candidatus Binatia bacterium]